LKQKITLAVKLTWTIENVTICKVTQFLFIKRGISMSDHTHEHGDACGCGQDHDHDHEHEEVLLTLTDENGNDVEMVLVETFDVEKHVYALLLERNNPEADGIILRMEEEDEEMVLYNIEDEEEWTRVEAAYNELVASQE